MIPKEALYRLGQIEFETGDYMNDDGYMMRIESTEMHDILKQAITEHEELKRDVKRFMELIPEVKFRPLQDEVYLLQQKLSKVGAKDV